MEHVYKIDKDGYYDTDKYNDTFLIGMADAVWRVFELDIVNNDIRFLFDKKLSDLHADLKWGVLSNINIGKEAEHLIVIRGLNFYRVDIKRVKAYIREQHTMTYWKKQ